LGYEIFTHRGADGDLGDGYDQGARTRETHSQIPKSTENERILLNLHLSNRCKAKEIAPGKGL